MTDARKRLVILTPAYNPSQDEILAYDKIADEIKSRVHDFFNTTFVIIDDGSNVPFTSNIARLIHLPKNVGKGAAIKHAINLIQEFDFVIYTDYDFPYTIESLIEVASALLNTNRNVDLVISKRSSQYFSKQPAQRRVISAFIKGLNKYFLGLKHYDTQAGLKALKKGKATEILSRVATNGYLFEIEFISKAEKEELFILSVPVVLREDVEIVTVSWKTIRHNATAMLKLLLARIFP